MQASTSWLIKIDPVEQIDINTKAKLTASPIAIWIGVLTLTVPQINGPVMEYNHSFYKQIILRYIN